MKYKLYRDYFKRIQDICLAIIACILLLPVFIVVAILVKINLGSPVIFVQERPGKDEKTFKILKFRTMKSNSDHNGDLLSDKIRLTKFGKLLRATSLDELPELINIIKGDMSIVGPRPLLTEYLCLYNSTQKKKTRCSTRFDRSCSN